LNEESDLGLYNKTLSNATTIIALAC